MIPNSGEVDTLERRATLQGDLDCLEEWANKNLRKLYKGLVLGFYTRENIIQGVQHRLGSNQLGSNSVERDLGILMDKLCMSEQCTSVEK